MIKKFLPCLVALLACAVLSAQEQASRTRAIAQAYLDIQAHLAADRFEELKTPARTLVNDAAAAGKTGEAVSKAAAAVEGARDIKAAREAFGPLSDAVIAHVRADGSKELLSELSVAYCPMARRSWLQREPQVRNPYYGSQMLTCGELKPLER